jgi:DNA processing protein
LENENYPQLLKEIPNPPYIIYLKGIFTDFNEQPMLAIVGSRKFTSYGKQVAYTFAHNLAKAGITVVSGMALGIDAVAHQGALDAGGKTIAVLGSSLEDKNIGPKTNFELSRRIMDSGILASDYPVGISSTPNNFPARNRLMAGMTMGTIVVEAAVDSGSLITANLALEFNREVFAVPGSVFSPVSLGTNNLIRSGAKVAASVKDILEELNMERRIEIEKVKKIIPASPAEESLLKILSHEPLHIDKIIKLSKLETSAASSTLTLMEMKGMIKNIGGQNYIIL